MCGGPCWMVGADQQILVELYRSLLCSWLIALVSCVEQPEAGRGVIPESTRRNLSSRPWTGAWGFWDVPSGEFVYRSLWDTSTFGAHCAGTAVLCQGRIMPTWPSLQQCLWTIAVMCSNRTKIQCNPMVSGWGPLLKSCTPHSQVCREWLQPVFHNGQSSSPKSC